MVSSLSEGLGHSPTAHAGCTGERAPPPTSPSKTQPHLGAHKSCRSRVAETQEAPPGQAQRP